jgi:hypothetical protein
LYYPDEEFIVGDCEKFCREHASKNIYDTLYVTPSNIVLLGLTNPYHIAMIGKLEIL